MFSKLALFALAMLFTTPAFSQTPRTHVYDVGHFGLSPGQVFDYIWNAPTELGSCNWIVTPNPFVTGPEGNIPEQRIEVTRFFLVRKGPGSDLPGQLVLNYTFKNVGTNPVSGRVIISAICLE